MYNNKKKFQIEKEIKWIGIIKYLLKVKKN
jgi:hypothetical protein